MGMTDIEIPDPDDMGPVQTWFIPWSNASLKAQAIQEILFLHGLVFRWLVQGRILLLDIESLYKAMNLAGNQDDTDAVMTVYKLLPTTGSDCLEDSDFPGKPFISPLWWLCIVTWRSYYH